MKRHKKIPNVPSLARWLLGRMSVYNERHSVIEDFNETFQEILESSGKRKAARWYWMSTLKSFPKYFHFIIEGRGVMFSNYLKTACRNLIRHKGYSFINVLGLAIGIACTILILQWIQGELSYDRFHENADQLYVVTFSNGSVLTPTALAGSLKNEYPEIVNATRLSDVGRTLFTYNDTEIYENGGIMADPAFLEMFTIPFIQGNPETALDDPHSIVLSKKLAKKYFGTESAIHKTITFSTTYDLRVTGVFENYPLNSHFECEYIVPNTLSCEWNLNLNAWNPNNVITYIELQEHIPVASVDQKIMDVVQRRRPQDERTLSLQAITRLHLYDFPEGGGTIIYVYLFSAMAFFILLIACINFVNLSTARSAVRAKEVGIRKTLGAERIHIIRQFFGESILLTLISLIAGIDIVILFLPTFNSLTGKQFTSAFLYQQNTVLWILGIILFTGLIAGSYPAFFLSHFQPVRVLKGNLSTGMKNTVFRKALVVVQFTLSIFLILGTLVVDRQLHYIRNRDLGLNKDHVIILNVESRFRQNFETIRTEMLRNPDILGITLTNVAPYIWTNNAGLGDVHWEGKTNQQVRMVLTSVDYHFLETFDLEVVQGRFFSKEFTSDINEAYVVNETAVKAMEMETPIGRELRLWDIRGKIIGVVNDYHFESLHRDIMPMAMRIIPERYLNACIRINPGNATAALGFVEEKWNDIYPEYPFEYRFLDDEIARQYRSEQEVGRIFKYFTFLAIFISCLGLFGLVSFTVEQRVKEIGIRKICGASVPGLMMLQSKEFFKLVLLAWMIATPASYFIMNRWLQDFAYRISFDMGIVLLAGISSLLIAFLTVGYHSIKTVLANPVDSLRHE